MDCCGNFVLCFLFVFVLDFCVCVYCLCLTQMIITLCCVCVYCLCLCFTLRAVMWQGSLTWEWTRSTMGEVGTTDISGDQISYLRIVTIIRDISGVEQFKAWQL